MPSDDITIGATVASGGRAPDRPAPAVPGQALGRYTLLDRIGTGAMGVVYAAYDPALDRRVALKVLHHGTSPANRGRLLREAQALGRLSHPNVVTVHDVGTHDEHVFLAMEYIRGQTLKSWMGEDRTWAEVLDVMVPAGGGLVAAHRAGLIHRDFKPDNVMVGDDGRVRVMDLGLVRLIAAADADNDNDNDNDNDDDDDDDDDDDKFGTSEAALPSALHDDLTRHGAMMGTPGYMAPEQVDDGHADELTDLFSFCVVLYEALYRQHPFPGESVPERLARVSLGSAEPPPNGRRVPRWVERAVFRGLSRSPSQRFASMQELVDLLCRRQRAPWRRPGAIAMSVGGLAALAGLLATTMRDRNDPCAEVRDLGALSWKAAQHDAVHDAFERSNAGFADPAFEALAQELESYTKRWTRTSHEACEATHARGEWTQATLESSVACLDARRIRFDALVDTLARADLDVVERSLQAAAGLPAPESCLDLQSLHRGFPLPSDPNAVRLIEEIRARLAQAQTKVDVGRGREVVEESQALEALTKQVDYPPVYGAALLLQGAVAAQVPNHDQALGYYRAAYVEATGAEDRELSADVAHALTQLYAAKGTNDDAGRFWAALTLTLIEGTYDKPIRRVETEIALAKLDSSGGRYEAAASRLRELAQRAATNPTIPPRTRNLVDLALLEELRDMGRFGEAREIAGRAVEQMRANLGAAHPSVASILNTRARLRHESGDLEGAQRDYASAWGAYLAAYGDTHPATIGALHGLSDLRIDLGQIEDALAPWPALLEQAAQARLPLTVERDIRHNYGNLLAAAKRFDQSEAELRRAIELTATIFPVEHPLQGIVRFALGSALLAAGRPSEAELELEVAMATADRTMGPRQPRYGDPLHDYARTLIALGRHQEARERVLAVLAIWDAEAIEAPRRFDLELDVAETLWAEGDHETARNRIEQARRWEHSHRSRTHPETADAWLNAHP